MKKIFVLLFSFYSLFATAQTTWQVGNTTLTESDLVTGVNLPWEILWGPDDYIWCTLRTGSVIHIDPNTGSYTTVLTKTVPYNGQSEPGMLGMAMHPDWVNTPKVYLVYNYTQGNNIKERLSVFDWDGANLVNEQILIDAIPGYANHNGSRLLISPDGKLLMTTGDTANGYPYVGNSSTYISQDTSLINGKILRINLDGSIPSDNPFPDSYIYTFGNRNPQGLCIGPNNMIYESEHGQNNSDEFNLVEAGRNYGWPLVEGACNTTSEQTFCAANNVREPLLEWSPCRAVNGIEWYHHPAIPEWNNCILMAVLGGLTSGGTPSPWHRLSVIHLSPDGLTATCTDATDTYFVGLNKRLRDICVNPYTGALYVALNGTAYPGSGPNIIKEFRNMAYQAVPNIEAEQRVSLFPNPTSEILNMKFATDQLGGVYSIYGFNGMLVKQGKINSSTMQVDAKEWSKGSYFIVVESLIGTTTKTFIVQ